MTFEPLGGKRFTQVTEQRTKIDWAHGTFQIPVDSSDETSGGGMMVIACES
jgi:hypothetical protein